LKNLTPKPSLPHPSFGHLLLQEKEIGLSTFLERRAFFGTEVRRKEPGFTRRADLVSTSPPVPLS
jgi:hypothetical protein